MKYSCCMGSEYYHDVAAAGYDAIVLPAVELARMPEQAYRSLLETVRTGAIPCNALNAFCPAELRLCGPGYDAKAVVTYTKQLAQRAAELGVKAVGVGSPRSRDLPEGWDRTAAEAEFLQSIISIADVLNQYGIRTLLEAVCTQECNLLTTTKEAVAMVKKMARSDVGLVYDIYHAVMMVEDPADYLMAADYVGIVHIAQKERGKRGFLSRDRLSEYEAYFHTIRDSGYAGEVSIETNTEDSFVNLSEQLAILRSLCQ